MNITFDEFMEKVCAHLNVLYDNKLWKTKYFMREGILCKGTPGNGGTWHGYEIRLETQAFLNCYNSYMDAPTWVRGKGWIKSCAAHVILEVL